MKLSELYKEKIQQSGVVGLGSLAEEIWYPKGYKDGITHTLDTLTPQIAIDFANFCKELLQIDEDGDIRLNRDLFPHMANEKKITTSQLFEEFLKQYQPRA